MSKGKKPNKSHTLTIHFDTKIGVENFVAWYLDGGGEQSVHYYTKGWGKDWMHVQAPEDACPSCEFYDEEITQSRAWQNKQLEKIAVVCTNCGFNYTFDNYYHERPKTRKAKQR